MAHASAEAGRIGPNAIIRVAETLRDVLGEDTTRLIFARAHLEPHLAHPPTGMVPEEDVGALQTALFDGLEENEARKIAFEAGLRTGDYLLANRIPKPAQAVLKVLPSVAREPGPARHHQEALLDLLRDRRLQRRKPASVIVSIKGCPLCRGRHGDHPQCDYYAGTFQRLFEVLVSRNTFVREVTCEATGGPSCAFEIAWKNRGRGGGSQRILTGKEQS